MENLTATAAPTPIPARISLFQLFLLYLKVGNITFGGGDPTMAALQTEMVASRGWISNKAYALVYTLARITPGTNLLAFCAGTAWELLGWPGAIAAVAAMTMPAALLVLWVTAKYNVIRAHPLAMAALGGVLAAAVGIMVAAAWQLARPSFSRRSWIHAGIVVAVAILLSFPGTRLYLSPIRVLGLAAIAGLLWEIPE